jgi:hypothetical protein
MQVSVCVVNWLLILPSWVRGGLCLPDRAPFSWVCAQLLERKRLYCPHVPVHCQAARWVFLLGGKTASLRWDHFMPCVLFGFVLALPQH